MFHFFSRKPAAQAAERSSDAMAVDAPSSPSVQQLRTPSPSEGTSTTAPAPFDSPAQSVASNSAYPQPVDARPDSLQALLTSVPAKTLHSYTLAHLANAPESTLSALSDFFSTLTPPPQLHCVRCHKDYVEVENGDRACLVAHDDDSAEVERVGRERRIGGGTFAGYETLWGCCGKTVEGDGDQGPPDGWCYEGKHTTDVRRARFRADSTPSDDKLSSCLRLDCHGVRSKMPRSTRGSKKRSRPNVEEDDDDEGSEGTGDSGVAEIAKGVSNLGKGRSKGKARADPKGKGKAHERGSGAEDADDSSVEASKAGSARGPPAPKSLRQKPRKSDKVGEKEKEAEKKEEEGPMSERKVDSTPKRGRKVKQKAEVVIRQTRSQSASRPKSRVRRDKEAGFDTGDEKTDGEGKGRKRRKLTAA